VSRATGVERSRLYRIMLALDKMGKIASPINSHIPQAE
jgi:sugar-specific transcriptional regulator TrmB